MLLRAFHDGGRWYVFPCLFPHRIVVRAGCKGGERRRENGRGIVGFVSGVVPNWNGTPSRDPLLESIKPDVAPNSARTDSRGGCPYTFRGYCRSVSDCSTDCCLAMR